MKLNKNKYITIILLSLSIFFTFFSCSKKSNNFNTLRMNISSEPDNFNPWKSSAADTKAILFNIFEGLTTFDTTGTIKPCIAESYNVSDDGLTYTFYIRKDVFFHNEKQLTGYDVLYTYKHLAGLDNLQPKSDEMQIIKDAYLKDDFTFVVELKKQSPAFLIYAIQPILQAEYDNNEHQPIGTGPYKFVSYDIHHKITLTKNKSYWNTQKSAKIDNIELFIISDEAAILYALQSNQLDIAQMISGSNAQALSTKFDFISQPQNMVQIFAMNNNVKPFDNLKVRKAIALATNKKEIIKGVLNDQATEVFSNFSPILKVYYNDELSNTNSFNIKKAKKLLKEAGFENGFDLTITVPANYQVHIDTAQIIASQLKQIGITAQIKPIEWASWLSDVYTNKNYQTTVIAFSGKLEPSEILKRYYSSYKRNFVNYNNPMFDKNFDDALTELNDNKRIKLFKECQKILAEDSPCVFICDPNNCLLKNKNVKGINNYPILFYDFASIYFN